MVKLVSFLVALQSAPQNQMDFVAIAGIVGTLFGTALGSFVTWKIQQQQLVHEDKTRFHDRRLTIYSDFTSAASGLITALQVAKSKKFEEMKAVVLNFELLRLVASDPVLRAAELVHRDLVKAIHIEGLVPEEIETELVLHLKDFVLAAREEIGVSRNN